MLNNNHQEALFPITFRSRESEVLADHLKHRHSVELVGMKRVGIYNFLKFFLYNEELAKKFFPSRDNHLFVSVDLNDLTEREIYPFWILTFKRFADAVMLSGMNEKSASRIKELFSESIQEREVFLVVENLRQAVVICVGEGYLPTFFLLRFDRITEAVTPEFLSNLQSLVDISGEKLAYVFTSFRPLDQLAPKVFERKLLTGFTHIMYLLPCNRDDSGVILEYFNNSYKIELAPKVKEEIIKLSGGHDQYLQILLLIIKESNQKPSDFSFDISTLSHDERISLLYDEIWESLTHDEQDVVKKIVCGGDLGSNVLTKAKYDLFTGIVQEENGKYEVFSPLFSVLVAKYCDLPDVEVVTEFTNKENMLFELLKENLGEVCDRDTIIAGVWPEYEDGGVSDWTIDRLVARLRTKLKKQESKYQVVTVKTRGYKLVGEFNL